MKGGKGNWGIDESENHTTGLIPAESGFCAYDESIRLQPRQCLSLMQVLCEGIV